MFFKVSLVPRLDLVLFVAIDGHVYFRATELGQFLGYASPYNFGTRHSSLNIHDLLPEELHDKVINGRLFDYEQVLQVMPRDRFNPTLFKNLWEEGYLVEEVAMYMTLDYKNIVSRVEVDHEGNGGCGVKLQEWIERYVAAAMHSYGLMMTQRTPEPNVVMRYQQVHYVPAVVLRPPVIMQAAPQLILQIPPAQSLQDPAAQSPAQSPPAQSPARSPTVQSPPAQSPARSPPVQSPPAQSLQDLPYSAQSPPAQSPAQSPPAQSPPYSIPSPCAQSPRYSVQSPSAQSPRYSTQTPPYSVPSPSVQSPQPKIHPESCLLKNLLAPLPFHGPVQSSPMNLVNRPVQTSPVNLVRRSNRETVPPPPEIKMCFDGHEFTYKLFDLASTVKRIDDSVDLWLNENPLVIDEDV